jgi:pimeloyl-ACP methyl ester carboxylesterase
VKNEIQRPNGRKLSFEDVGPRDGKPVFYFHGVPSAAIDWHIWGNEDLLHETEVRLIAVDRPGVGDSSFQTNRRLSDWPAEVIAVADALRLDRFHVLGYSGGGPYVAVCAALIPERLLTVGMVSSLTSFDHKELLEGITPGNIQFLSLSIDRPWMYRFIYSQLGLLARLAPQKYVQNAMKTFDSADQAAFTEPQVQKAFLSARGSPRGQEWDTRLIVSPWDFDLGDIHMPVYLWQGDQDHNASPAMGRFLEKSIPDSRMAFLPGEGHISLIVKHAASILNTLTSQAEEETWR